jgi:hypothetical protein
MRAILLCMRCALASHNCTKLAPNATHNTCVLSRVTGFDAVGCVRAPIFASHPISPFHQPVRSSDHQYHQYATISPSAYPISRSATGHQHPSPSAHPPISPSATGHQHQIIYGWSLVWPSTSVDIPYRTSTPPPPNHRPISPFHQPVRSSDHQYHQYATISPSAYPISRSAHQPPAINTQAHQPIRPSAHQPPAINTRSSTDGRWCGPPPPSIYLTAHPPLLLPTIGPSAHQPISHRPSTPDHLRMVVGVALHLRRYTLPHIHPSSSQPSAHQPTT